MAHSTLAFTVKALYYYVQDDPELEAIRQRRMQELIAQHGGAAVCKHFVEGAHMCHNSHKRHV